MASVTGTNASETLDAADGVTNSADTILGLGGNDTIFGLGGNDYIKGGGGADTINGGSGIDTASYSDSGESVWVDLDVGATGGTAEGDVLISIENLEGSSYNDFLGGNASANVLAAGGGNDHIEGGGGADRLDGGAGIDTAYYNDSFEGVSVNLSTGEGIRGTAEGDVLISIENLVGSDFSDFLIGDDADNVLRGGNAVDFLEGGGGADTLDGGTGAGFDIANYSNSSAGVNVSLTTGRGSGGDAQGDVLISIENLVGSDHGDTLVGNSSTNDIQGRDGNDFIYGERGPDSLNGGGGVDYIEGGSQGDFLNGGTGGDTLLGQDGDDELRGDGSLFGGGGGNDTLDGGSGHDLLYGDEGADLLIGGADVDYFFFDVADSGELAAGQADVIFDFLDEDQIYLGGPFAFAGGGVTEPGEDQYTVFSNDDDTGWILRWNSSSDDGFHDVLVHGDNPLGDISFFT